LAVARSSIRHIGARRDRYVTPSRRNSAVKPAVHTAVPKFCGCTQNARRTFQGTGTHAAVERAARMLVARNIRVSALSVCNPAFPPQQYVDFFASCGIAHYDIMIPDATVDEAPAPIASFYNGLFDLWLEANRSQPTAEIRIVTDMITALLANNSPTGASAIRRSSSALS
jgi:hypothetical protein